LNILGHISHWKILGVGLVDFSFNIDQLPPHHTTTPPPRKPFMNSQTLLGGELPSTHIALERVKLERLAFGRIPNNIPITFYWIIMVKT